MLEKDRIIPEIDDPEQVDRIIYAAVGGTFSEGSAVSADTAAGRRLRNRAKRLMGAIVDYKELMMMYACAIKEVQTKFDVLNTEFKARYMRNPISSVSTRLKKTSGIIEKLSRKDAEFTLENIVNNIHDVAGVRVVCSYIDDIYILAEALLKQDDITLIERKDYIMNPKPNGYRSLHLIVSVPVFFSDRKRDMEVEVQIRTIAMDFWASLEHQLKYKKNIHEEQEIVAKLKKCADVINETDNEMQALRDRIEGMEDTPTDDDILSQRISSIDIAIN